MCGLQLCRQASFLCLLIYVEFATDLGLLVRVYGKTATRHTQNINSNFMRTLKQIESRKMCTKKSI